MSVWLVAIVQEIFGDDEFAPRSSNGGGKSPRGQKVPALDVVDEGGAQAEETEEKNNSWYVPEITENLLDELAAEEPLFQKVS